VLVVDDDHATRELIMRALSHEFKTRGAGSGEEAIALIASSGPPDAAVVDVMMPGMDGFELARQIRARPDCAKVPLMFLTARDSSSDVVSGIRAGARHYMTKPFKLDELLDKVRKMVKH
jgi:two-component system OmpR family response regulator